MSSIDELMSQIPIGQLASQLGVSEGEADAAVKASLPALLGGMEANAKDPAGAASLQQALGEHDGALLDGGVDLSQVDTADGAKIVKNVFGDNEGAVVNQLGGLDGLNAGTITKLLPMLAPLLMSFLGKSIGGGSSVQAGGDDGGGLGGLLGGLLGGGDGGGGGLGGLGGLGDVLGGLLGGGKK
jgi:hypothetical protein